MRHDGGNPLKYQDYRVEFRALPLKAMECEIYQDAAPAALRGVAAVETLRQVWVQQFYLEAGALKWRDIKDCPPSSMMIASPYDLDSRYRLFR
jgi:hypothetical protein